MKVVFATLNAKYIHLNLALRSIGKYCEEFSPVICEYTINDNIDSVIASLHTQKADVLAFSCYIWNIEKTLYIAECLKKVNPDLTIVLGGHEVSYDGREIMENNPFVDFIIRGEGEKPMHALLSAFYQKTPVGEVPSLAYRKGKEIIETPFCSASDINEFPFPYDDTIRDFTGKIVYYESSRGCPFNCSYCLSGDSRAVSFLQTERVKKELLFFIEREVPLVKFVDRTFNADLKRAKEIWRFIIEHSKKTRFHFELAGSIIDDETIEILKSAKEGIIQFEIGVQSTNPKTMGEIGRTIDLSRVKENVLKLLSLKNIHIHLDLIAGLPYEDYESFKHSFDEVALLRPHVLQLGFLKLLKGSRIRTQTQEFGYKFKEKAPYEVMENNFISFDELIKLKAIEDLFEKYYNSGDFKRCMDFLFEKTSSPFAVFETVYNYYLKAGLLESPVSLEKRYEILEKIFPFDGFSDCVKADRITNKKAKMPYENEKEFKERCFEFLKKEENIEKYLPHYIGVAPRNIYKRLRFEKLYGGVYLYEETRDIFLEITKDF